MRYQRDMSAMVIGNGACHSRPLDPAFLYPSSYLCFSSRLPGPLSFSTERSCALLLSFRRNANAN